MASEKDWGLENEVRSRSSDQGRRWRRRRESERLVRMVRRAGVVEGRSEVVVVVMDMVVWGVEIGRMGGEGDAMVMVGWGSREKEEREGGNERVRVEIVTF